jgi:hypothetical protein
METSFVPAGFVVPTSLAGDGFHLEPLGPEHNERDHAAWMSSIDHIHSTPGLESSDWPESMSLAANLTDLERHARDFGDRYLFAMVVLSNNTKYERPFATLLTLEQLEERMCAKRMQWQINLHSIMDHGTVSQEVVVLAAERE